MNSGYFLLFILTGFLSVFVSQTLVDISDSLIVFSALYIAFKQKKLSLNFFRQKIGIFFSAWFICILIGLAVNFQNVDKNNLMRLFEFKWIITLFSLSYLYKYVDQRKLVNYIAVIYLFLNLISIVLYFQHRDDRAGGILDQVMSFSHNIGPTFCFVTLATLFCWDKISRFSKLIAIFLVVTSALLTIMTITRGVWIASILSIFVSFFIWNKKALVKVAITVGVVVAIAFTINPEIMDRFIVTEKNMNVGSNYIRMALYKANWEIIKENPIWGVGLGQNTKYLKEQYLKLGYKDDIPVSHAHNQFLEVWANTGVLGLLFFVTFYCWVFWLAIRLYKIEEHNFFKAIALGLLAAVFCFELGSLSESNFNISKNRFFFLLLAGWVLGRYQVLKSSSDEKPKIN
jgi:O-antigen ligase